MELQVQVNESLRDIDTLYRTLRRRARPHPDEPSSSRPRTTDSRPAQPEPDDGHQPDDTMSQPEGEFIEREFDETASRSRDDDDDDWFQEEGEEEDCLWTVRQLRHGRSDARHG